jgi:cytochrome c-type biogenesis protein CcmF
MPGKILIYIAFLSSIISLASFFITHLGKKDLLNYGRIFYHITSISIISASVFLLYLIVTHQFQYAYVWEESNIELQLPLLISTFYAGQEGSFMLWTLFTAIIGIFLLNYVSKGDRLEPQVMSVYNLVLGFLTLILILKTPFNYVWEAFPKEVEVGFIPLDGRGLNPLLQNFWMSIHPPTLFIGFSSLAVPFAFAIAALMKNKYKEWITFSLPWLLFSGGVLGIGIMMGGYWAYGVLGWGGYWGWDPVENSSLIPLIITVSAIHTTIIQKKIGGYIKTNLILSILAFLLVLYSTFLTRSGILGNSSVHSFVDPGAVVYLVLVIFISSFVIISIISILFRLKELKSKNKKQNKFFTKETFIFIGALAMCAAAVVITVGTSLPLISKGAIESDFYNKMNLPIAILITFVMGFGIFLEWTQTAKEKFLINFSLPVIFSIIGTIILITIGLRDTIFIIFAFTSLLAFFVNLILVIRIIKNKKSTFGGALAHVGIAMFFLGVIGSGRYSEEINLNLELNKPVEAFDYKFTYTGAKPFIDANNKSDTMYHFNVKVEKDNKEMTLKPVMYFSKYSNGVMKNPDMINFASKDLYISPMGFDEPKMFSDEQKYEITKGEKKQIGKLNVEFLDFDFGNVKKGGAEMVSGNYIIGATLKVNDGKNSEIISPKLEYVNGEPDYIPVNLSGNPNYEFYFVNMKIRGENDGSSVAVIAIVDLENAPPDTKKEETLIASVSIKPFMCVLWAGVVILGLGFFIAIIRKRK